MLIRSYFLIGIWKQLLQQVLWENIFVYLYLWKILTTGIRDIWKLFFTKILKWLPETDIT